MVTTIAVARLFLNVGACKPDVARRFPNLYNLAKVFPTILVIFTKIFKVRTKLVQMILPTSTTNDFLRGGRGGRDE